jgi:UDP-glucose 4-epimerase
MERLVNRAKSCGIKKFIYISTSHVYGKLEGLINERSGMNPLNDYALAHFSAEQMIRRHAGQRFEGVVFRPNAVYGIPLFEQFFDRWSLIPFSFPIEAVEKQRITLKTPGEQYRNFISHRDCARHIVWMPCPYMILP